MRLCWRTVLCIPGEWGKSGLSFGVQQAFTIPLDLTKLHFHVACSHYGQLARSKTMGAKIITNEQGHQVYDLGKMWIGEEYETGEIAKDGKGNNLLDDSGKPVMITAYRYHHDLIKEKFLKPAPVCWADPSPKRSVISVACGELFILVVARDEGFDSKVYSAGNNGYGQLGHGDTRERHELTSVRSTERFCRRKQSPAVANLSFVFCTAIDQSTRGKIYYQSGCRINPCFSPRYCWHWRLCMGKI
jgi:hypothetical protein